MTDRFLAENIKEWLKLMDGVMTAVGVILIVIGLGIFIHIKYNENPSSVLCNDGYAPIEYSKMESSVKSGKTVICKSK